MFNDIISEKIKIKCTKCEEILNIKMKPHETKDSFITREYYCGKCAMELIENGDF